MYPPPACCRELHPSTPVIKSVGSLAPPGLKTLCCSALPVETPSCLYLISETLKAWDRLTSHFCACTVRQTGTRCCNEHDKLVVRASLVHPRDDLYLRDDSEDCPEIAFPRQKMLSTWHKHKNNSCLHSSPNGQTCNAPQSKLNIQSMAMGNS